MTIGIKLGELCCWINYEYYVNFYLNGWVVESPICDHKWFDELIIKE